VFFSPVGLEELEDEGEHYTHVPVPVYVKQ